MTNQLRGGANGATVRPWRVVSLKESVTQRGLGIATVEGRLIAILPDGYFSSGPFYDFDTSPATLVTPAKVDDDEQADAAELIVRAVNGLFEARGQAGDR